MGIKALKNGRIITPTRVIENGTVIISEKEILDVGPSNKIKIPSKAEIIDVKGNYVSPGFIDIHVHGGGGADVMDCSVEDIKKISKVHARGGSTSMVLTTLTAPIENIVRAIKNIGKAKRGLSNGAKVLGAHIEGPYISMEQGGAQNPEYIRNPVPEEYEKILEFSQDICRMTAAPEIGGALKLGRALVSKGIVPCIGHSNATYEDVLDAIESGYAHVTHIYCSTSTIRKIRGGYKVLGVTEAALLRDELTVEMIADGKHLPPSLMKLIVKAKGLDKVCVVTDAMLAAGMPPGNYKLGGLDVIVDEGVAWLSDRSSFAGSVATMDLLVRNMVKLVEIPIQDAVKLATINPARVIGVDGKKGSLVKSKDADIVVFDDDINILLTMIEGKVEFEREFSKVLTN